MPTYLVPGTDDPSKEHEEVAHCHKAGPDYQGEKPQELLEDRLDADQDENRQEDGQGGGNGDEERHVVLDVLRGHGKRGLRVPAALQSQLWVLSGGEALTCGNGAKAQSAVCQ